jgi:predicted permease
MGQMMIESLLLALIGGAAGLLVAQWGGTAIQRMLVPSQTAAPQRFIDWRVLGVVGLTAIVAGLLAGLAPALMSGRGDLAPTLRSGQRGGMFHRSRVRAVLLVTQGALSVVLLIGAALFVRSLRHVREFRMGYDPEPVLMAGANMRGTVLDSAHRMQMRRDLVARAQAIPGVRSAAYASSIPFWSSSSMGLYVPGIDSVRKLGRFTYQVTTPDFFTTFGTRILRGRAFTDADREGAPLVAVVSEAMAGTLWPGRDAIGQCMHVQEETRPCTTVVGIAENIIQQQQQFTDPRRFQYYLPLSQMNRDAGSFVLLRMAGKPAAQAEGVRKALQAVMPGLSYVTMMPMSEIVDETQRSWSLGANLFVAFGFLALVVAAVGLYGVMAYNVTQRMHELGVRVALGAGRADILRLVVGQSARFTVAGVVVGSALALVASRYVEPLLFQQSARDPTVYLAVGTVMLIVAMIASLSPARRATSADPNVVLRSE